MSTRTRETGGGRAQVAAAPRLAAWPLALAGMSLAAVQAARPRQWPKNLLVFAAPLAGATLGRHYGLVYALVAFAAFTAASSAVYLINDVMDTERDQLHPVKRQRAIASGRLPRTAAMALAAALLAFALAASLTIGEPRLAGVIGAYVTVSLLYSLGLKHVPGAELAVVALGFVLRAIGGAVATHVPPSAWFLTVCSLGALMVAIGKRYTELTVLGSGAVAHRPADALVPATAAARRRARRQRRDAGRLRAVGAERARPVDAVLASAVGPAAGRRPVPVQPADRQVR